MAMYEVVKIEPRTYINDAGLVIQGYRVHYRNLEFNEADFVDMPTKNSDAAAKAIMQEVTERKKLSQLGK